MDPFALQRVAGHQDIKTTSRYVHPSEDHIRDVIEQIRKEQGGHTFRHTNESGPSEKGRKMNLKLL
jgi:hypothetical protein